MRPSAIRMFLFAAPLAVLATGCGGQKSGIVSIPDSQLQVVGLDGAKKAIPSSELFDAETGEPTVKSVLVIDRNTNRQMYLPVDQLPAEAQANARYILVTENAPAVPSQ